MTSRRAVRFAAAGAVITALAGGAISLASPSSHPPQNPADQFAVLAGAAHYVVYAEYPVTNGGVDYADGALHIRSKAGANRNLGVGFATTDPQAAGAERYSLIKGELTS